MATHINWLHLTDWHVGQRGQVHLWPNLRSDFERDVGLLVQAHGPIDLVILTGDLVQSGQKSQFQELEVKLQKLWSFFESLGPAPKLITIPGNHDMRRPGIHKTSSLAISGWHHNADIRDAFWTDQSGSLRKQVGKWFSEYTSWLEKTDIPLLNSSTGILPGDFSATFEKEGTKLGIVGLNTTFVQCKAGDFEGKISCSVRQLQEVCGADYVDWLDGHHLSLLLTHHPLSWFSQDSKIEFEREIAPPGRFRWHLCGHLHKANTSVFSIGGSDFIRRHQGASFFGLEFTGEEIKETRMHGYLFGRWSISDGHVEEMVFPRKAVPKTSGELRIQPDPEQTLNDNGAIRDSFKIKAFQTPIAGPEIKMNVFAGEADEWEDIKKELSISPKEAVEKLARSLRFTGSAQPHHLAIRTDERQAVADALGEDRRVWLVADWGLGKDSFIASVVGSKDSDFSPDFKFQDRVFHLRCDTFEKTTDLEEAFRPQLGMSVQDFVEAISVAGPSCLILDGIQSSLTNGDESSALMRLFDLLVDHSSGLSLIIVGRVVSTDRIRKVDLRPLDLPELRGYIQHHPNTQPDLLTEEALERIFEASGGLTVHVDRMLERLRVASLDAVLNEETALIEIATSEAPLHKALQQAIAAVRKVDEETGSRGLKLLKSLSLLTYGETIEQIKRFFPTEPFYLRDAELLDKSALIEIIALSQISPSVRYDNRSHIKACSSGPKILRVPKQVRDCVLSNLSDADKDIYLNAAADYYFRLGWRLGRKPKLRKTPDEYRDYVAHGVGNEYGVLQMMIVSAEISSNDVSLRLAARLGIHYCGVLRGASRYRDLRLASRGLLRALENTILTNEVSQLHRLCGRACRMTNHDAEAIDHFSKALEAGAGRESAESRAYTLLQLCGCLQEQGNKDEAEEAAQQLRALARPGTMLESQGEAKILNFQPDSPERKISLMALEKKAREKGWISHANDLTLERAYGRADYSADCILLDEVLATNETGWNRVRAIVEKAFRIIAEDDLIKLSGKDKRDLQQAYAFCHSQRLTLFNRCHKALWTIMEREGRLDVLYSLFKHGSFIWRLRGEEELEIHYFERLKAMEVSSNNIVKSGVMAEMHYFAKRAAVLVIRLIKHS